MKINKTNVSRVLRKSTFDPKKDAVWAAVVDVGSFDYCVRRAMEACTHALRHEKEGWQKLTQNDLTTAISLLAAAKLFQEKERETAKNKRETGT